MFVERNTCEGSINPFAPLMDIAIGRVDNTGHTTQHDNRVSGFGIARKFPLVPRLENTKGEICNDGG